MCPCVTILCVRRWKDDHIRARRAHVRAAAEGRELPSRHKTLIADTTITLAHTEHCVYQHNDKCFQQCTLGQAVEIDILEVRKSGKILI